MYDNKLGDVMKVNAVYFSATETTKKVVCRICKNLINACYNKKEQQKDVQFKVIDFTSLDVRKEKFNFDENDIVVIGVPTIAGRVPNLLLPFLNSIDGNNAICIPIVTFGNRNFDDSLIELSEIMKKNSFNIIAAGAFVGEHSFSNILAKDRPDKKDFMIIDEFSNKVSDKILKGNFNMISEISGEVPYRNYFAPQDRYGNKINFISIKPNTKLEICNDCKICYEVCPLKSIDYNNVSNVSGKCMKCCACIKKCPNNAKYFDDKGYVYHKEELEALYYKRKEPVYFL